MKQFGILFVLIILVCGCNNLSEQGESTPTPTATPTATPTVTPTPTPTTTPTATPTPEENGALGDERAESLELEIRLEKTTYKVGEKISGEYYVKYDGEPFKAKILYCHSREGFEKEYYTLIGGQLDDIDFDNPNKIKMLKDSLTAFILEEGPVHLDGKPYFQTPADYIYSIYVYDCAEIETELNVSDCGYGEYKITEKILGMQTIESTSKTITVIES